MRLDPYRVAYEQASDELNEIGELFNLLRVRKQRIEKVILAFKPLIETSAAVAPSFGAPAAPRAGTPPVAPSFGAPVAPSVEKTAEPVLPEPVEQVAPAAAAEEASAPPTYSFLEVPAPLPELPPGPSDPFQRRVFRFRGLSNEHRGIQRGA
jgi:hypothetical protein